MTARVRCARPGCKRFAGVGVTTCFHHNNEDWEAAGFGRDPAGSRFLENIRSGTYRALAEEGVARVVAEAGAEPGLRAEIGLVRVALARLLEEEPDAGRFALGVARLVAVAVQAARVQRGLTEVAKAGAFVSVLQQALEERDRECLRQRGLPPHTGARR